MTNRNESRPNVGQTLAVIEDELSKLKSAPQLFLHAWKRGVELAGTQYFGEAQSDDVQTVTCKWDLCPKVEFIRQSIGPLSPGEKIFLASLVSFYNAEDGGRLLRSAGVDGFADLGRLDPQRRAVIAALILHYTGW